MKKGFTLVELSIVLVIIGLLIGGILVAQSMIRTAKIQMLIRQMAQFDASVENFQTKYGALPGDTSLMGCINTASTTCNNGIIEVPSVGSFPFQSEVANFWSNLSASGLINENGDNYSSVMVGAYPAIGTNIPKAKLCSKCGIIGYGVLANPNYFALADFNSSTAARGFIPLDAYTIDLKIDDGVSSSGQFFAFSVLSYINFAPGSPDGSCRILTGPGFYNLSTATEACGVWIRMGASTGNLK